jgi:hypothetical protein
MIASDIATIADRFFAEKLITLTPFQISKGYL